MMDEKSVWRKMSNVKMYYILICYFIIYIVIFYYLYILLSICYILLSRILLFICYILLSVLSDKYIKYIDIIFFFHHQGKYCF